LNIFEMLNALHYCNIILDSVLCVVSLYTYSALGQVGQITVYRLTTCNM